MSDYRVDGPEPRRTATPAGAEEAAAVLQEAAAARQAVVIRGLGTKDHLGGPLRRADLEVSTLALRQVVDYNPGDLTITVGAGLPLADLQAILAREGQVLPLDPPEGGTVGGMLAAAAAGPRRHAFGGPRDLVLGMHVALTSGEVIKSGSRMVKNVAGYDLNKLFIGSMGTLGLITEATLKVRPLPESRATLALAFLSLEAAAAAVQEILHSELVPTALTLVGTTLEVILEEAAAAVRYQESRLAEIAGRHGGRVGEPAARPKGDVRLKGAFPIAAALRYLEQVGVPYVAYAGTGVVYLYPPADPALIRHLRTLAASMQGSLVLEAAPPDLKREVPVWGEAGPAFSIMQRLKQTFDPAGILAPGRFLGGI